MFDRLIETIESEPFAQWSTLILFAGLAFWALVAMGKVGAL